MTRLFTIELPDPCPARMTRKELAAALTQAGFSITPRTLASWPLTWIPIAGRQTADPREAFDCAQRKIDDEHERMLNRRGRTAMRRRMAG